MGQAPSGGVTRDHASCRSLLHSSSILPRSVPPDSLLPDSLLPDEMLPDTTLPEARVSIEFRTLDYRDVAEVRAYLEILYAISAEGDEFHFDRTAEFIDRAVIKARREEDESNTFAGIALERALGSTAGRAPDGLRGREIVGLHILRRFEEGPAIGAHIGGLWVAPRCRRQGVASRLKTMGESWARGIGAAFLNTNVLVNNERMLKLNRARGFVDYRVNMRKRL
jgi:ribosomal protein S18 acetylase RimI-like enzyme